MKRFIPTSLALLLVMASFGHVLAAAFCPRVLGRECCFAKTSHHAHGPSFSHVNQAAADMHMDGMAMDGMNMDDMAMGDTSMDHAAMADRVIDAANVDMSILFPRLAVGEGTRANRFDQPAQSCAHCLGYSGIVNAPVSSVSVPNQSDKNIGSAPLPGSSFTARPALTVAQIGLPGKHAPPGSGAPRYILINVFLI
jgi:uncharacterized protein involved in copper resistance